jgi:signal transduction histidine kinase
MTQLTHSVLNDDVEQLKRRISDIEARLLALTEGAESLLATRDEGVARAAVIDLAQRVLPADGYAIWWLDVQRREWWIVHSQGVSEAYASQRLVGDAVSFTQPLLVNDVFALDLLEGRREAYRSEGIVALITVPLPIHGERRATLVAYHRGPHNYTETDLRVGMALGQIAAAALGNAETNAAQDRAKLAAERHAARMAFLADASALLGSLDYETTLRQVAHLAVPRIADWCAVDMLAADGSISRIVTAHVDPEKVALAQRLHDRYPTTPQSATGIAQVLRTGEPEFYPAITDDLLVAAAKDDEHLAILRALGLHSVLIAPLVARGRTLGAITFVSATAERAISTDDATILTEVGRRASLAIDNALLYREVEIANRAKDEFLALLSHELRTPLNAIMGWSHMLRQGLPAEMQPHALDVIARNAQSQKQLVEDLLDVARIATGKLDLQRSLVDLCDVGRAAVESALPAAQAKGLTLVLEMTTESLCVQGDLVRLQQVAANLIGNAIKFTDTGGRVTVQISKRPDGVAFMVSDTGVGIPSEFLPHAFERFRQADGSLSRTYSGLGLGLWIVKQVAEGHGGHVRADSDGVGRGARVEVVLPSSHQRGHVA